MRNVIETPLPPAPGEERSVALALVNTRTTRGGVPDDALETPAQAGWWLAEHGLAHGTAAIREADAAAVRDLRTAVRTLLDAAIDAQSPPPDAVEALNAALRAAPSAAVLHWPTASRPRRETVVFGAPMAQALARLAENAVTLLCRPAAASLARCPAEGCVRLLLRTHGRRHWCSTRCGDRVRAARYYARRRAPSTPTG